MLITGGLAPVTGQPVDEVYAATWARTRQANQRHHARYPGDLDRLRTLLRRLDDEDIRLPNGDRLTVRRFRQTGMLLATALASNGCITCSSCPSRYRPSCGMRSRRLPGSATRSTRRSA